jgi:hypothetical protein
MIIFLASGLLGNFTTLGKVFANLESPDIVKGLFKLPDTSYVTNILAYIKYLQ